MDDTDPWQLIQKKLGVQFLNINNLIQAFTARSNHPTEGHHQRFEFIGDALLYFCVKTYLYHNFNDTEKAMTLWTNALINNEKLAKLAHSLDIVRYMRNDTDDIPVKQRKKRAADLIEALIGAIYIDQGYLAAAVFIARHIMVDVPEVTKGDMLFNPISVLQEIYVLRGIEPEYREIAQSGTKKAVRFTVGLYVNNAQLSIGQGSSLQEARKAAAASALSKYFKVTSDLPRGTPFSNENTRQVTTDEEQQSQKALCLAIQLRNSPTFQILDPMLQQLIITEAAQI